MARTIFITGSSGLMGRNLIPLLLRRGHTVRALARPASESRVPSGCEIVAGDALDARSYAGKIAPADSFVHLVGVAHPNPAKADEFKKIDGKSVEEAVAAAKSAGVRHFIYVSVAHPAPMMHVYIEVRSRGEEIIRASGLNATFVRPWYVLGPGRRWPVLLIPMYWVMGMIPSTRESAQRLGLVTLAQMMGALCRAVENPPDGVRIIEVPEIRRSAIE